MLDSRVLCDQQLNERRKQRFAPLADVVHELEEPQVDREFLLGNAPMRCPIHCTPNQSAGERNRFFDFSCFRFFNFCVYLFIIYPQHDNAPEYTIRRLPIYPNIVFSCIHLIVLSS
jgi:hypothetical protein